AVRQDVVHVIERDRLRVGFARPGDLRRAHPGHEEERNAEHGDPHQDEARAQERIRPGRERRGHGRAGSGTRNACRGCRFCRLPRGGRCKKGARGGSPRRRSSHRGSVSGPRAGQCLPPAVTAGTPHPPSCMLDKGLRRIEHKPARPAPGPIPVSGARVFAEQSAMSGPMNSSAPAHDARAALETWSRALDLRALAAAYGTPLYVIHEPTLRDNFTRYLRLVDRPERIRYPVKANPSPEILEIIAGLGGGADCAARDEVWAALGAGIPTGAIAYGSPAPDLELAEWLLRAGATVVADSLELLADLADRLAAREVAGRLFVRVN